MSNPNPDTGDPAPAGDPNKLGGPTQKNKAPTGDPRKLTTRPVYGIHAPNNVPGVVPAKKAFGIDVETGPYSTWRIYNDFKIISKDPSTWPVQHTLLQDWHIPHVVENMTCADRKERHPADFDGTGQIRAQRLPRGRAAKLDSQEDDGTVKLRYMVYKNYYQLHGDEGAAQMAYHVKNASEATRGPAVRGKRGWTLGDRALVSDDFIPTALELRIGTNPARYDAFVNGMARSPKGMFTSKTSRPRSSRSRIPGTAPTHAQGPNKETLATANANLAGLDNQQNTIVPSVETEDANSKTILGDQELFLQAPPKLPLGTDGHQDTTAATKLDLDTIIALTNMDDDPLGILFKAENPQVQKIKANPGTQEAKFEAFCNAADNLGDIDETRADALKAADELYRFFLAEILCFVVNKNQENHWLIGGLHSIENALETFVGDGFDTYHLKKAHVSATALINALKERRKSEQRGLRERLEKSGLFSDDSHLWQAIVEVIDPVEKEDKTTFGAQPGTLQRPAHEADLKSTLKALRAKCYLNKKVLEHRNASKNPEMHADVAPSSDGGSAKRLLESSEGDGPLAKRHCVAKEILKPSPNALENDDNLDEDEEDDSSADESEASAEPKDAITTGTS